LVLGYGFGDDHVTRILEAALMNPSLVMLVVEPNPTSPTIERVSRYKDLGKRAFVLTPTSAVVAPDRCVERQIALANPERPRPPDRKSTITGGNLNLDPARTRHAWQADHIAGINAGFQSRPSINRPERRRSVPARAASKPLSLGGFLEPARRCRKRRRLRLLAALDLLGLHGYL
jgi:hypothetical protein